MVNVVVLGGGISGLATAYSIQELSKESNLEIGLTLIEKEKRVGGKVMTIRDAGFLCEGGPAGFMDKPETLQLCGKLGIKTLSSRDAAKKRFIFTGKKLRLVPESPTAFLKSDILSLRGKLRILREFFTRPSVEDDETIADFAKRHLGKEAEEKLIGSMVAGIYAGDSERLSIKSCFPVMLQLEKEGAGSLIRAMFKRMKKTKKGGRKGGFSTGNLTSFSNGMDSLIEALKNGLDDGILTGKNVLSVGNKNGSGYEVSIEGEKSPLIADILVIAMPAYTAAEVLKGIDAGLNAGLTKIPYAPATVICLGYREADIPQSLNGFGFLIPKKEGRRILGCRWDSSTFDYRAPSGHALLEVIVGGASDPETALLDDKALIELVNRELKEILGIEKEAVYTRIFRHEKAIPQYVVGHSKILEDLESIIDDYPGLFLTGNAYRGIGINDCTKNAPETAKKVIDFIKKAGK